MKPIKIITLLAALIFPAYLNAQVQRFEADIQDFTELRLKAHINVRYVANPDSAGKAVFYANEEQASEISFVNNKKKLTIEFTSKGTKMPDAPVVTVYSRFLTIAENHSDSTLRLEKVAPGPSIKLRLIGNGRISASNLESNEVSASVTTGNGTIAVTGNCSIANLTSYSTGTIQADNLKADKVKLKLLGTGEIGCWPVDELYISMSLGSGTVLYRGTPVSIRNHSAGIKVKPLEEEAH